jgi:hypothetical protein
VGLSERWLVSQAEATAHRAARRRRRDLERELAGYSTPAQVNDLEALLDSYPDGVTHEYREILHQQTQRRESRRFPAIGRRDP